MERLHLDAWSDIACPWCYVGKRRLEAALQGWEHRGQVALVWRSFELDPRAPRGRTEAGPYAPKLAAKYRTSVAEAEARIDRLVSLAAGDGLELRFDRIRPGNTFDAHRVLHLARARGRQDAIAERLFRGYLTDGRAIGDPDAVRELAVDGGLDEAEVVELLAGDRFAAEVRADEGLARELGIRAVPCFVIDRRIGISGAQPVEALRSALAEAWRTRAAAADAGAAVEDGAACGPDGCG
jgi:predicted DsbA family dithiol-disulfide isomerase